MKLQANAFALATGLVAVLYYILCMLLMWIGGKEVTVAFFNSLLHGLDVASIVRMNVPLPETLLGLVLTFVLGWLGGWLIATSYNRFAA